MCSCGVLPLQRLFPGICLKRLWSIHERTQAQHVCAFAFAACDSIGVARQSEIMCRRAQTTNVDDVCPAWQERDGAEVFVDVLHEHLRRWQQHCGAGAATEHAAAVPPRPAGPIAAALQLPADALCDDAASPARPSDSSSSLTTLATAAAAYDSQLAALKAPPGIDRLNDSPPGVRFGAGGGSGSARTSPADSLVLSPASSAVGADELSDPELLDAMEQGWQYGQPNR